jgi:hypothetical protein
MFRSVNCIAGFEAADVDLGSERDHGNRDQRERDGEKRRQKIENLVDVGRYHIFLGHELDDVGERLQQSVRSHAARADAKLDVRDHLALDPLQVGERVIRTNATTAALIRLRIKKFILIFRLALL